MTAQSASDRSGCPPCCADYDAPTCSPRPTDLIPRADLDAAIAAEREKVAALVEGLKKIASCEFECLSEDDPYCSCGVEDHGPDALSYCWAASAYRTLGIDPAPPTAECNACTKWGECSAATKEQLNDDGDCNLYEYDTRLLDIKERAAVYAARAATLDTLRPPTIAGLTFPMPPSVTCPTCGGSKDERPYAVDENREHVALMEAVCKEAWTGHTWSGGCGLCEALDALAAWAAKEHGDE